MSARKCPTCSTRYDGEVAFCAADGTPLVELGPDDDALVGTVFADRYRILRVLGQGNIPAYVQGVTERFISNSRDATDIAYLVALAEGLGRLTPIMQPYAQLHAPGQQQ